MEEKKAKNPDHKPGRPRGLSVEALLVCLVLCKHHRDGNAEPNPPPAIAEVTNGANDDVASAAKNSPVQVRRAMVSRRVIGTEARSRASAANNPSMRPTTAWLV